MAILRVPPESMWPTGSTPPELAAAIHSQGGLTPEEVARARAAHNGTPAGTENYRPPPRPVDRQALEEERVQFVTAAPTPPVQPVLQRTPPATNRYQLPLSRGVVVELVIHGSPTPKDYKLLGRYVRLMAEVEPAPPPRVPSEPITVLRRTEAPKPSVMPKRARRAASAAP